MIPGMPETTNGTLPSSAVTFDIQLVIGKEISNTFQDRRGSVKWAEIQEINYTKKFQSAR